MTTINESAEVQTKPKFYTIYGGKVAFIVMHLMPLLLIFTGATTADWIMCGVFYFARMFFITAGYHRYFAHRAFSLNRFWQFIFAFGAQSSGQQGVLWWSGHHRQHHKYSDTEKDLHSPKQQGFWHAHVGWIFTPENRRTPIEEIKDFAKYPELRFLNKHDWIPPWILGFASYMIGGWSGLVAGFFISTIILYHSTFTINSLTHKWGKPRYKTGDESKNSWILALTTLGEGWHNNHHFYQNSARQGFFWWEFDITFYILKILSWIGIVKDLRPVPERIKYAHKQNLRAKVDKLPSGVNLVNS